MTKSKYPEQLDSSAEIPAVRDNVTEITSAHFNSIRSAILQIEKTLGTNPHGVSGNTVAGRLNQALDENGNIKEEALSSANVIFGPILNNSISEVASIDESKLNLNFSTHVLQDQISVLNSALNDIHSSLSALLSSYSAHINALAENRHSALSISISESAVNESDEAINQLEDSSLQKFAEDVINKHINYSGADLSESHNSHKAAQIFFDNSQVESVVSSTNLQQVIEELAAGDDLGLANTFVNITSNGRLRRGKTSDEFSSGGGTLLIEDSIVTYVQASGSSRTVFTVTTPIAPSQALSQFDVLFLSGSLSDEDNQEYLIDSHTVNGSSEVTTITVFGGPKLLSASGLTATIRKNQLEFYNKNGLNAVARPRKNRTNIPDVQVANPNSATLISSGLKASTISATVCNFKVTVDDEAPFALTAYDSSLTIQTVDSIVNKINEQCVDNNLNFLAYKIKVGSTYEIALSHNIPNFSGDLKLRKLTIESGASNDGIAALGFTDADFAIGTGKNYYIINGGLLSTFGSQLKLTNEECELSTGNSYITLYDNPAYKLGIRAGDLLIICDADDTSDSGTFRIASISGSNIYIDGSYVFTGSLNSNSQVLIIRACANINEMTFDEAVSVDGSILFDIFLNDKSDVFWKKRLEVDGELKSGAFYCAVSDVSKNFIIQNQTASITINTDGTAYLTDPSTATGDEVYIGMQGSHRLYSSDRLSFVTVEVYATALPLSQISVDLFGFAEIKNIGLRLSRGTYSTSLGRVLGYADEVGIPSLLDKRVSGCADDTIISEPFIEKYIEGPRSELIGNGIISGCEVLSITDNTSHKLVTISSGVYYCNGIRYEFSGIEDYKVNIASDFYIVFNRYGVLETSEPVTYYNGSTLDYTTDVSPFASTDVSFLAFVYDGDSFDDLRLFIDKGDLKFTNQIVVSNDQNFGHFKSLKSAVDYAKRFTEMFNSMSTPSILIREGEFSVSERIVINFDLNISGSGSRTIIKRAASFDDGVEPNAGDISQGDSIFYVGELGSTAEATRIKNGVSFSSFTYKGSASLSAVSCVISLANASVTSKAVYRVTDVNFLGSQILYGSGNDSDITGEYAITIGKATDSVFDPRPSTYGNIMISNCLFDRMGTEFGPVRLLDATGCIYKNIIASGNIITGASPVEVDTSFEVFESVSASTLTNVIEANNVITLS